MEDRKKSDFIEYNVMAGDCIRVFDSASKKVIYKDVDVEPQFPGGQSAWQRYINTKVILKNEWTDDQTFISSAVVSFIVNSNGAISDLYVLKRPAQIENTEFESYFLQLVASMPSWNPGLCGSKPVPVRTKLSIGICLERN